MPAAPPQVQPGSKYGVPGITQRFEQPDTTQDSVTLLSAASFVPWNNVFPLQKTDVIHWWELAVTWTNVFTLGTEVVALSPYAPYNLFQNFSLQMQGQYKPLDVISGFDAALFQMYRPMRGSAQMCTQPIMGTNTPPSTQYANSATPQANLMATPNMITTTTPVTWIFEVPGALWFDQYWDLAEDGTVMAAPISAYVSPQYMGGGERIVTPRAQFSSFAASADNGPQTITTAGTVTAFTSSVLIDIRRVGVYASTDPSEMPPVFNWQYQRRARQIPIGAQSKIDFPITDYGQILSIFVRMFDPGTGTGGTPISITNVSKAQVLYGSNLPRFDDSGSAGPTLNASPYATQKRFFDQHGFLPPVGTLIWDFAITDTGGYITNAKALNTLTNANVKVHVEFVAAPSAQAFGSLGLESLVFVSNQ
jgi:hypothetical protein